MITLQHTLVTLFGELGDERKLDEEIVYVLIPDAIRRYCGPRQYSHFEEHPINKGEISWMEYPTDIKHLNREVMEAQNKHLAEDIQPCALGEKTHIEVFEEHNKHLSPAYFAGVKKHLTQDVIFDEFIREQIDCSKKLDDEFEFKGEKYDGKGVRALIADIENHGLYIFAFLTYATYGIIANQEWFDKHVKQNLDREYPQDLADATYKYMHIPEDINKRITECDWSHLHDGPIPCEEYLKMYKKAVMKMPEIDLERREKELEIEKYKKIEDSKPNLSEI